MTRPDQQLSHYTDEQLRASLSEAAADLAYAERFMGENAPTRLAIKVWMHRVQTELEQRLYRDAMNWRALMSSARFSVMGSANLGKPGAHIGLEFWADYPGYEMKHEERARALQWFMEYITPLVERLRGTDPTNQEPT